LRWHSLTRQQLDRIADGHGLDAGALAKVHKPQTVTDLLLKLWLVHGGGHHIAT
jgi:hypothetical protein